jgi:hypothetical protein
LAQLVQEENKEYKGTQDNVVKLGLMVPRVQRAKQGLEVNKEFRVKLEFRALKARREILDLKVLQARMVLQV